MDDETPTLFPDYHLVPLSFSSSANSDRNVTSNWSSSAATASDGVVIVVHLVAAYASIFVLAIAGNLLVMLTLTLDKTMRSVTNVFLFNLSVGDFLLGVLCMPFTLAGFLLKEFVFGSVLCSLIPYFQAVSVSVSAWTLVAMSVERYFAICHPLRSRKWQTLSHAYRMIAAVWLMSLVIMLPILLLSRLQSVRQTGRYKCRESWPDDASEKAYTLFLDVVLLMIPLMIMSVTYCLIIRTLWRAMAVSSAEDASDNSLKYCWRMNQQDEGTAPSSEPQKADSPIGGHRHEGTVLRRTNVEQRVVQKRRIVKMLFVVVLEFFVCWTPLYVINTVSLFQPRLVYSTLGSRGVSYFYLLAYASSCCNPVTYCFMNARFRESFRNLFRCGDDKRRRDGRRAVPPKLSGGFGN